MSPVQGTTAPPTPIGAAKERHSIQPSSGDRVIGLPTFVTPLLNTKGQGIEGPIQFIACIVVVQEYLLELVQGTEGYADKSSRTC